MQISVNCSGQMSTNESHTQTKRLFYCIPTLGSGGAERQLAHLAPALAELGYDVHIAWVYDGPNLGYLEYTKVQLHPMKVRRTFDPRIFFELRRLVRSIRPDVLQSWLLMMDILGGLVARREGIPWVLSERTSGPMYTGGQVYSAPRRYWLRRRLARRAAAVISNSSGGDEYWQTRLPARVRRYVIPNSVPFEEIDSAPEQPAGLGKTVPGQKIILHVGRFSWEKNLDVLLPALREVLRRVDARVVMCGDGYLFETYRRKLAEWGLLDRFLLLGNISSEQIYSWMKRADVMVSGSLFEGCPNAILEATVCGCPLVVSDIAAYRDLLDDRSAVLADVGSEEAFASAVLDVLEHPEQARLRAETAVEVSSKLTLDRIVRQYDRVYRDLLEAKS